MVRFITNVLNQWQFFLTHLVGNLSDDFRTRSLERQYMNVIGLDGKPQVKPLIPMIKEWLTYRIQVVTNRLNYRLDKIL
jgi:topoisomerase-4 subunit A